MLLGVHELTRILRDARPGYYFVPGAPGQWQVI